MQPTETAVGPIDLTQWEELVARAVTDGAPGIVASYVPGEPPAIRAACRPLSMPSPPASKP